MGSSIAFGITYVRQHFEQSKHALLTLCDLPLIAADHYANLILAAKTKTLGISASNFDGFLGVPAVFQKSYFEELSSLSGSTGAKKIIEKYAEQVTAVPSQSHFADIDTTAAYEKLLSDFPEKNLPR